MVTVDDVFTRYWKPSVGKVVYRRKGSRQTSQRLKERQEAIASIEPVNIYEKEIYDKLISEGKCKEKVIYKPGVGYVKGYECFSGEIKKELKSDS